MKLFLIQRLFLFYIIVFSAGAFSAGVFPSFISAHTAWKAPVHDNTPPYMPDPWPCDEWEACSEEEAVSAVFRESRHFSPAFTWSAEPPHTAGQAPVRDSTTPPYMPDPWPCDEWEACSEEEAVSAVLRESRHFSPAFTWSADSAPILEDIITAPALKEEH